MSPIRLDVWSDVACPWCYIGKRRLEAGIASFAEQDGTPIGVVYHSFLLSPDAPAEFDGNTAEFLARHKGIPVEDARRMQAQVATIAADVGLDYDFDAQQPTNTHRAHEVLHLARARGLQHVAKERLFAAHFVEGRHIGRRDELAALGADVGLDPDEVREALDRGTYRPAVEADLARARELGIGGVPFHVIDGRYGVSGAQSPEVFAQALAQVAAEHRDGSAA